MKSNVFATVAKIGVLLLLVCGILNVYGVLRYIQTHRTLTKTEQQVMEIALQRQALEGILRDFMGRASTDSAVLDILKRDGMVAGATPAASSRP